MKTEKLIVANLKCSGCAATIRKELLKTEGVSNVEVDVDHDIVSVTGENFSRREVTTALHRLGYPEATEKNGLLLQVKSYASCMLGRMNKMQNQ
ncbi:MAG TPA: heavy-metal-associated domain-containing protein [Cyclobacteriaceae bacterium]|nr:heavy-metal-associated domain-containing protein [Cyclobacteriaceae bacterium]